MNPQEIKAAVTAGKTVHWSNKGYKVVKDQLGQYLVQHHGGSCIGLTWSDGTTLNGKPEEFFLGAERYVEWDEEHSSYGVFDSETGHCSGLFSSKEEADGYLKNNSVPS